MCGIVGIATNFTNGFNFKEVDAFQDMLFIDTLRGVDSTGVFGVDKHSNVEILKEASHGLDFIMQPAFKEFKGKLSSAGLFAVGHNRAATRGTINDKNAHPFWVDDRIILVHNGTVRGDHKKDLKDVEVDSEAIAHMLAEEPDISKAFKKINSAFALCWFNTQSHTLHLLRNSERPMWWVRGKNNGYFWASEEHTLNYVLKKYSIETTGNPEQLAVHKLMTFEIDGDHYKREYNDVNTNYEYKSTVYTGGSHNSHVTFRHPFQGYGGWGHDGDDDYDTSVNTSGTPPVNLTPLAQIAERRRGNFTPKASDVKVHFSDYAVKYLTEFRINPHEVGPIMAELHEIKKKDGRVYVEIYDYLPANSEPGCTTWHLYGAPIHPREENMKVIVNWIVYNRTKEQIKEEVDVTPFYHVRVNSVDTSQFMCEREYGEDGVKIQEKKMIIKCYGMDARSAYEVIGDGDETSKQEEAAPQQATH